MNLGLLAPAGLAALAALALPLLIHLRRRAQRRVVEFAALRWLAAREVPRRRRRLEERRLLALRLLLIALLALLLAAPAWRDGDGGRGWVAVAPGVDVVAARTALAPNDAQWHWLAPGFPVVTQALPAAPVAFSSLLRELDVRLGAEVPLTVVVPPALQGLDGERLALRRAATWRIAPASAAAEPAPPPTHTRPTQVAIRYDGNHRDALRWLRAATQAWNATDAATASATPAYAIDSAPSDAAVGNDTDWLLWLADAPLPAALHAWVDAGGTALWIGAGQATPTAPSAEIWHSASGDARLRAAASGAGRMLALSEALQPDHVPELLDPEFPELLRSWFVAPPPAPQRAQASSQSPTRSDRQWPTPTRSLDDALLLAIAIAWLLERWLATRTTRTLPA